MAGWNRSGRASKQASERAKERGEESGKFREERRGEVGRTGRAVNDVWIVYNRRALERERSIVRYFFQKGP